VRNIVYVAGPYAGDSLEVIERNVGRAVAVGFLAVQRGLCPVVPHTMGWLHVHGAHDESVPGVREAAIQCGVSLAYATAKVGGILWVVSRDDGSLSAGTQLEVDCYRAHGGVTAVIRTWDQWVREGASYRRPVDDRFYEMDAQIGILKDETTRLVELVDSLREKVRTQ
jgi:hypothetical protein